MKKVYGVWINLRNGVQVRWWNIVSLFVKAVDRQDLIEKATGQMVGCLFAITGPFAEFVAWMNTKLFVKNPVKMEFEVEV